MLKFLKSIFKKESEKAEIRYSELDRWFDEKTKEYASELDTIVNDKIKELSIIKAKLDESMKELMEEEIKDEDKILPKVKNVVLSARQNYARELGYLLKDINIENSDKKAIANSCKLSQEKLDIFSQKTAKSYYTTQHLFHKPLENITSSLKEMGLLFRQLNESVRKSKSFRADDIKTMISRLNKDRGLLAEWKASLGELETKKKESENRLETTEKELLELTNTAEYKKYEQDIKILADLKEELTRKSNLIFETIAPMQAAIKKYERIAMDNVDILKRYLSDVVTAFLEDKDNLLLEVLNKVRDNISKGSIEIKDKKKDKLIKQIEQITKEKLEEMRKEYNLTKERTENIKEAINKNNTQQRQEELIKKKEKIKDETDAIKRDINELKDMLSKIDIEKEEKEIAHDIESLLGIEVVLNDQ